MESIWNAQTGALAVERMCWSAVEIACSWKPCSGTHTFERSQWNHIETEALPMNVNHHQVEDLALQNLGNSWNACNGTHVLQHMLYVCIYIYMAASVNRRLTKTMRSGRPDARILADGLRPSWPERRRNVDGTWIERSWSSRRRGRAV